MKTDISLIDSVYKISKDDLAKIFWYQPTVLGSCVLSESYQT